MSAGMTQTRKSRHWISIVALAVLVFAQGSIALAACQMDRGTMGPMQMDAGCDGCPSTPAGVVALDNTCVAHCTSDLQLSSAPVEPVCDAGAATAPWLTLPADQTLARTAFESPPPRALPARILLHSFLI